MIRRPPRSTLSSSSAASDVYKRQGWPYEDGDAPMRTATGLQAMSAGPMPNETELRTIRGRCIEFTCALVLRSSDAHRLCREQPQNSHKSRDRCPFWVMLLASAAIQKSRMATANDMRCSRSCTCTAGPWRQPSRSSFDFFTHWLSHASIGLRQ